MSSFAVAFHTGVAANGVGPGEVVVMTMLTLTLTLCCSNGNLYVLKFRGSYTDPAPQTA